MNKYHDGYHTDISLSLARHIRWL